MLSVSYWDHSTPLCVIRCSFTRTLIFGMRHCLVYLFIDCSNYGPGASTFALPIGQLFCNQVCCLGSMNPMFKISCVFIFILTQKEKKLSFDVNCNFRTITGNNTSTLDEKNQQIEEPKQKKRK